MTRSFYNNVYVSYCRCDCEKKKELIISGKNVECRVDCSNYFVSSYDTEKYSLTSWSVNWTKENFLNFLAKILCCGCFLFYYEFSACRFFVPKKNANKNQYLIKKIEIFGRFYCIRPPPPPVNKRNTTLINNPIFIIVYTSHMYTNTRHSEAV